MIVSKPRTNTIVSFLFFLLITVGVLAMNVVSIFRGAAWYNFLIVVLLVPIGLLVSYRIFIRYKIIRLGNNQVEIHYPVLGRKHLYSLQAVANWRESIVKTGKNSVYKELEIEFEDKRKLSFGQKEQTEYDRVVAYLKQKVPKKKIG